MIKVKVIVLDQKEFNKKDKLINDNIGHGLGYDNGCGYGDSHGFGNGHGYSDGDDEI